MTKFQTFLYLSSVFYTLVVTMALLLIPVAVWVVTVGPAVYLAAKLEEAELRAKRRAARFAEPSPYSGPIRLVPRG